MKKALSLVGASLASGVVLAVDFNPETAFLGAQNAVTAIATSVGSVLVAAAAIYLAFIGWRKFREACNRI